VTEAVSPRSGRIEAGMGDLLLFSYVPMSVRPGHTLSRRMCSLRDWPLALRVPACL
jgi:hypothetical protein